mmetsp:Transcript_22282/g.61896  ORF Transcript_22282/g.61896 Transcript_22282/m.61896 type:complete len:314 (-) Transcript_22282:4754-5695(-)
MMKRNRMEPWKRAIKPTTEYPNRSPFRSTALAAPWAKYGGLPTCWPSNQEAHRKYFFARDDKLPLPRRLLEDLRRRLIFPWSNSKVINNKRRPKKRKRRQRPPSCVWKLPCRLSPWAFPMGLSRSWTADIVSAHTISNKANERPFPCRRHHCLSEKEHLHEVGPSLPLWMSALMLRGRAWRRWMKMACAPYGNTNWNLYVATAGATTTRVAKASVMNKYLLPPATQGRAFFPPSCRRLRAPIPQILLEITKAAMATTTTPKVCWEHGAWPQSKSLASVILPALVAPLSWPWIQPIDEAVIRPYSLVSRTDDSS